MGPCFGVGGCGSRKLRQLFDVEKGKERENLVAMNHGENYVDWKNMTRLRSQTKSR